MSYDLQIKFPFSQRSAIIDALRNSELGLDGQHINASTATQAVPEHITGIRRFLFSVGIQAFMFAANCTEFNSKQHSFQINVFRAEAAVSLRYDPDLVRAREAFDAAWLCLTINKAASIQVFNPQSEEAVKPATDGQRCWQVYEDCASRVLKAFGE